MQFSTVIHKIVGIILTTLKILWTGADTTITETKLHVIFSMSLATNTKLYPSILQIHKKSSTSKP